MFEYDPKENLQVGTVEYVNLREGDGTVWGYCDKRLIFHRTAVLPDPEIRIYRKVRLANSSSF